MGRTPVQQSSDLQILTAKTNALTNPASSINLISGPLMLVGQGPYPAIIAGLSDIVNTASNQISSTNGSAPITAENDANQLLADFTVLVLCQQQLLNILIGKAGLFASVPFLGPPVAAVLRQLEAVLDTIAFSLVDQCSKVTTVASGLSNQQASLDQTLAAAIHAHDGIAMS